MINEFKTAMQAAGITPPDHIIGDGQLHRFHIEGDKRGTKNGAYFLYLDGKPNGWFSNWRGDTGKWSASGKKHSFTSEMRQQIQQDRKQREEEKELRYEQAAKEAERIYHQVFQDMQILHKWRDQDFKLGNPPFDCVHNPKWTQPHPYLTKKCVRHHNAKVIDEKLVIPIFEPFNQRRIVNLQFIFPNGEKRFLSGAKKKGCFSVINSDPRGDKNTLLLCEGWATGASLNEETGHKVIVALDAGNLLPVAQVLRRLYPQAVIIVCGDNDAHGKGQKAAKEAANEVGGRFIIPPNVGQDWNDHLTNGGTL
jgi:putative DNA primase/helicase